MLEKVELQKAILNFSSSDSCDSCGSTPAAI